MDAADIIERLNQQGREIAWLAAKIGAPTEEVHSWLYADKPMEEHWRLAISNVLLLDAAGLPCATSSPEPLTVVITVRPDDAEIVMAAADLASKSVEEYALDAVVDDAKRDLGID